MVNNQTPVVKVCAFDEEEQQENKRIVEEQKKNVRYLAYCYLTLFIALNSTQNLVSSLYKQQGFQYLGLTSLLFLYLFFAVTSLVAKNIIVSYQYHHIFAVSALGYSSFILSGVWVCYCSNNNYTDSLFQNHDSSNNISELQSVEQGMCQSSMIYFVVITASILCGISSSFLWVGQGGYMDCIFSQVKSEKGTISGIFWSIRQLSHVIGNLAAMIILNSIDNNIYFFIIMGLVSLTSSVMFFFIAKVEPQNNKNQSELQSNLLSDNQISESNGLPPISVTVHKVFVLMKSLKFLPFLFFTVLSGIIVAFSSGFQRNLVKATVLDADEKEVAQSLSYVLICFGIFEYIGGKISGKLADKYNIYHLATIGTLIILFGLLACLIGLVTQQYMVCFLIGSIFGFSDCYLNNISQVITNNDYKGQLEIFQAQRFVFSVANTLTQACLILLSNMPEYSFLIIFFIITLIANFVISLFPSVSSIDNNNNNNILGSSSPKKNQKN